MRLDTHFQLVSTLCQRPGSEQPANPAEKRPDSKVSPPHNGKLRSWFTDRFNHMEGKGKAKFNQHEAKMAILNRLKRLEYRTHRGNLSPERVVKIHQCLDAMDEVLQGHLDGRDL